MGACGPQFVLLCLAARGKAVVLLLTGAAMSPQPSICGCPHSVCCDPDPSLQATIPAAYAACRCCGRRSLLSVLLQLASNNSVVIRVTPCNKQPPPPAVCATCRCWQEVPAVSAAASAPHRVWCDQGPSTTQSTTHTCCLSCVQVLARAPFCRSCCGCAPSSLVGSGCWALTPTA